MKKPIGIKIIKRWDIAILSAAITPDVVNREAATVGKKPGASLPGASPIGCVSGARGSALRKRETSAVFSANQPLCQTRLDECAGKSEKFLNGGGAKFGFERGQ